MLSKDNAESITGPALASRLTALIPRLIGGEIPRLAGLELWEALDKAESIARRKQAFLTVILDVDPAGRLSRWATAEAIAYRLKKFKSAALRRIKAGDRVTHDDVERALVDLCDGCCSAGKIWEKLRDMNLPEQR
ncbi:MAG TPA: hypothetical protein P5102_02870 [Candidatus Competibacteraceae bacterium]|nr:hypothetical protein [Candidatus Competibacteraceae bacterium]HRZ05088.1 hypothetical protein [Candidatus Competibacteraceae bacterium]HSA48118.1 hypothetical protein [Candidatus Competibacteraceae bacterium]